MEPSCPNYTLGTTVHWSSYGVLLTPAPPPLPHNALSRAKYGQRRCLVTPAWGKSAWFIVVPRSPQISSEDTDREGDGGREGERGERDKRRLKKMVEVDMVILVYKHR